jgi:NAD(P)-dependent dehydrogenase (short-subunit alcohol dehydrogenase family)
MNARNTQSPKVAVVTGAGSGIGLAVARRLLGAGFSVVLNGRDEGKLARAARELDAGDRVALSPGHVGDERVGRELVALASRRFGGLDVLVNNAGIFAAKPFLENRREDLDAFLDTNLKGTYFTTQAAVPALIERGGGAVVNVGTVLVEQPMQGLPASAAMAAKGGIHAVTRSLAAELARHRIRVTAVAPGIIRTPLIGDDADAHAAIHPLGRVGEAHEIAEAVHYLATAEFVTGVILPVDGGYANAR